MHIAHTLRFDEFPIRHGGRLLNAMLAGTFDIGMDGQILGISLEHVGDRNETIMLELDPSHPEDRWLHQALKAALQADVNISYAIDEALDEMRWDRRGNIGCQIYHASDYR